MPTTRKIGTKFDKYVPLTPRAIVREPNISRTLLKPHVDLAHVSKFQSSRAPKAFGPSFGYSINAEDASDDLEAAMKENFIRVAPAANVENVESFVRNGGYGIDAHIKAEMETFDFYIVELGFNVALAEGYKLPKLDFHVDFYGDGELTPDVVSYNSLPTDKVNHIEVVGGEIGINLDPLLKLIPSPIGQVLPNVLSIKLNPWKFSWNYDRIEIDFSGDMDYNLLWKMKRENIHTGFKPTVVLKKKKSVSKVLAKVKANYALQNPKENPLQLRPHVDFCTSPREIPVVG